MRRRRATDPKSFLERFPSSIPVSPWILLLGFFLLTAAATTFYTIPADSEGIVLRFGKYIDKTPSGLHAKLPFGIDSVIPVPSLRQQKLEFGFVTPGFTNPEQAGNEPVLEKSMVTGDLNAVLVEWIVQYRITEPEKYLFDVRYPDNTLRDLSEAAMREVIGDRTVDEIITIGRQEIEETVRLRIRELSALYQLGFSINQVQLKNVNPPELVQPSFNEVNRAQQDRENLINLANGEYNKAVPRARGEADQQILDAEGYRYKRVNEAEGDVSAFNQVLAQYLKAPDITRMRLYLETLGAVLPQARQQIIVDDSVQQILPMLPMSPFSSQIPEAGK
ncbi:MAG: FtsH protease activity modulator HflK [Methylococcales bacterium]|nr:FtsH protease activity modulator HflK [Methylococcales bacterium]